MEHRLSNWLCRRAKIIVLSSMAAAVEIVPIPSEAANPQAAPAFNPEFDLLVACSAASLGRHSSDERRANRIRQILSHPLNWDRMLDLVDHHRVVSQVYGELSALSHPVPARSFDALRLRYQDNARKALWFTHELARILNHLESAGIKALPYKGPVLAKTLYGEVTRRQFTDLDILILPVDVPKAKATLMALGYACEPDLRQQEEPAYIGSGCGYVFHSPAVRNLLDLQWRIVPRFYSIDLKVSDLFARADEIVVGDGGMRTLCAEDVMLVLCVHAAKHVWVQLSWLCDIAQLANSQQLDWNAIQNEARRLGIERIVNLNLLLAHELLGSAVPPTIRRHLREDPATTVLADEVLRIIAGSVPYDTETIPYFRLMLRLRERWQHRARFLWRLAVTPSVSEWSAVRLPKHLKPLYRLVRLWRLARRLISAG
jgi:hypothetical protein